MADAPIPAMSKIAIAEDSKIPTARKNPVDLSHPNWTTVMSARGIAKIRTVLVALFMLKRGNSCRTIEWWHRRDQAPIQQGTLSPVATHDLIGRVMLRVERRARHGDRLDPERRPACPRANQWEPPQVRTQPLAIDQRPRHMTRPKIQCASNCLRETWRKQDRVRMSSPRLMPRNALGRSHVCACRSRDRRDDKMRLTRRCPRNELR
jgi:hypothetical protein